MIVAVFPLMRATVVAEHGGDSIRGDGTFVHARDSRGVVTTGDDGAVADVGLLG